MVLGVQNTEFVWLHVEVTPEDLSRINFEDKLPVENVISLDRASKLALFGLTPCNADDDPVSL